MMELNRTEEMQLTVLQAKEFLEERRGFADLPQNEVLKFVDCIYAYERQLGVVG